MWNRILEALFSNNIKDRSVPRKKITEGVKPRIVLINGDKVVDRTYPLDNEELEGLVKFLIEKSDGTRIFINAGFVKSMIEEIAVLREEKRNRLKLLRIIPDKE